MQNLFSERMTREIDRETGVTYGEGLLDGRLPVCASVSAAATRSLTTRGETEDRVLHCHHVAAL